MRSIAAQGEGSGKRPYSRRRNASLAMTNTLIMISVQFFAGEVVIA
jgi:hypothetical protein